MKIIFSAIIALCIFCSCKQSQGQKSTENKSSIPLGSKVKTGKTEAVATFAEGCFWHAEIIFQSLAGVRDAVSGFSGGTTKNPSYEQVSTGRTGHTETVQVYYDPAVISYATLVKALFASMDPTQLNRQGNDSGTEYRSAVFYRTEEEKAIVEAEIKRITDAKLYKNKIVTEVTPFVAFYPAEDYHQEYVYYHPDNSYVANVSIPEFLQFKKEFKGNFKP